MIPASQPDFHNSLGEKRVYLALRTLADRIVVIHSLRWLHPGNSREQTRHLNAQGEADFVLFDPERGVMVVEVKGGEVWCEQGEWRQRNRRTHQITAISPEAQASDSMHRIRTEVIGKIPEAKDLLFCHAVWFPDGAVDRSTLPMNYHPDMILDAEDVARPEPAIQKAFKYWQSVLPRRPGFDKSAGKRVLDALAPSLSIVPSACQSLDEREEQLVQLTMEQAKIIHFLDEQTQAAIIGAAGTGKTMLAIEKARRLASPTEPVLFLCYNSALREYLATHHAQANVRYLTFHGLAREIMGPEGSLDDAAQALIKHLAEDGTIPYEHLIIDEGQDFDHTWLEWLCYHFRDRTFYIFYDRYQAIQGEMDTRLLDEVPCRLVLTRNCRNSDPIARVAYRAGGLSISPTLGVDGPLPVLHRATDDTHSVNIAASLVEAACNNHKTPPHEVAVLTLNTLHDSSPWRLDHIGGQPTAEVPETDHVTVTTVRKFKGLEAALVVIVDVDLTRAIDDDWRRRLYVACSRARLAVHIITTTTEPELKDVVPIFAKTTRARPSWRSLSRHLGVRLQEGGEIDPFNEPRFR